MAGLSRAAAALALGGVALQTAPVLSYTAPGRLLFPSITRVDGASSVALTFDDGPDRGLDQFLRELERLRLRATFFLVGEQVERFPSAPAEIAAAGHEIAVHGYHHRLHLRRTPWELADDLRRARAIIEDASGRTTTLYRPPYGVFSAGSWRESGRQGWQRVLWSRWGRDWERRSTPERITRVVGTPVSGDIVLLHDSDRYSAPDSWRATLAVLPIIAERVAEQHLSAGSVSDLLAEQAQTG